MPKYTTNAKMRATAAAFVLSHISLTPALREELRGKMLSSALETVIGRTDVDQDQYLADLGDAFDALMNQAPTGTPRQLIQLLAESFDSGTDVDKN